MDRGDLALVEQHVGILEYGLLALRIGYEVRRLVALVELHTFDELKVHPERIGLLHGDHSVLADLVDRLGDHLADSRVGSRDGRHVGDLVLGVVDLHGLVGDGLDHRGDCLLDAPLEAHRVGTCGHVAEAFMDQCLGQHGRRGGAVSGDVIGLSGDLLDQLGTHVLETVFKFHLTGDGDAIVGDGRGTELLV